MGKKIPDLFDPENAVKACMFFNHFMLLTEIFFFAVFMKYQVFAFLPFVVMNTVLTLFSYYLIKKKDLYLWTSILYFICLETMIAGTVTLGTGYGFSLYSISLITVAFYLFYIGKKIRIKPINPLFTSVITVISYFVACLAVNEKGPVYVINEKLEKFFFVLNSLIVFSIVIGYMYVYLTTIFLSERELEKMANLDKLTGLYNRHYLLSFIESLEKKDRENSWIAILDIDNFKKVNDVYGHNCGDYVLSKVALKAKEICSKCIVCRWGGEEFIILGNFNNEDRSVLEKLRSGISETIFSFEENTLKVTVTIGFQSFINNLNTDNWISEADKKLYTGKTSGKNKVVY